MMFHVLAGLSWDPGFRGILIVAVAVAILFGSIALILATNQGARHGFLVALTALFGWLFVLSTVWSIYGTGPKGPAPTWRMIDVVAGSPKNSAVPTARSLPMPYDLPDPVALRDASASLTKEFPKAQKDPQLSDIVSVDTELGAKLNKQLAPWKLLPITNRYVGEIASDVGADLGPTGNKLFTGPTDYVVLTTYATGGKSGRINNSVVGRVESKIRSLFQFNNKPFLSAIQIQPVIPQTTKPGQAPPLPVIDRKAPIYTVVLERDRGALRLPSIMFMLFSLTVFVILANMLHRRDRLAAANRALVPA